MIRWQVAEMFTNQLSWLRHANVDFDKKEPDIRVPGNNARDTANATAHLYTRYTFARAGGSRGVSRNSSSSSNDDVNPRPIHLFWLLYSTPKSGFSLMSFLFHSYDFRGCISRWINERAVLLLAAYFPENFNCIRFPTVPSAEKAQERERKRETRDSLDIVEFSRAHTRLPVRLINERRI